MATLVETQFEVTGLLQRSWPDMPLKIDALAKAGRKYLYTEDDFDTLLLGGTLPPMSHKGKALVVWTVTVYGIKPQYAGEGVRKVNRKIDDLIYSTAREHGITDPIVICYVDRKNEIFIQLPQDFFRAHSLPSKGHTAR